MSPVLENPKKFVTLKQLNLDNSSINSKLTTRDRQHYNLAYPDRKTVFNDNYDRRYIIFLKTKS